MSRWVMHDRYTLPLGVKLHILPSLLSSHICWLLSSLCTDIGNNITEHCQPSPHSAETQNAPQLSLGVRKNKDHRGSAMLPQEWPQFLFQCKLRFASLFTTSKEQTKEYILFSGLGACLWSTFHCLERTCSARFSHCSGHSLGSALQSLGRSTGTFSKPPGLEGL